MKVRINDLAREMGIKSRLILKTLPSIGVTSPKKHSSSLDEDEAARIRAHLSASEIHNPKNSPAQSALGARKSISVASTKEAQLRQDYIARGIILPGGQAPNHDDYLQVGHLSTSILRAPSNRTEGQGRKSRRERSASLRPQNPQSARSRNSINPSRPRHEGTFRSRPPRENRRRVVGPANVSGDRLRFVFVQSQEPREPRPIGLIPCTKPGCDVKVYPYAMSRHIETFHTRPKELRFQDLRITHFPFVLLPPGTWEYSQVSDVFARHSHSHRGGWEQKLDLERIANMRSLQGVLRHFGLKCWFGYGVYEFPYSRRVALECPIEGNATYILEGDWKNMICLTKAEIRREHSTAHVRVLHTKNWRNQVREALKG